MHVAPISSSALRDPTKSDKRQAGLKQSAWSSAVVTCGLPTSAAEKYVWYWSVLPSALASATLLTILTSSSLSRYSIALRDARLI